MIRLFEPGFFGRSRSVKEPFSPAALPSIAEAFTWCESQSLVAKVDDPPEIKRRRSLFVESGRLYVEAYRLNEKYPDGPNYARARELSAQADPLSLVMLRAQLRELDLSPGDIGELIAQKNFANGVSSVVEARRSLLTRSGLEIYSPSTNDEGRLLFYWPYENLADGASEYSSNGFFDVNDAPPWDTWISFDAKRLVSWVPSVLVPLAQAGIDANAAECIRWAG
jgi:hypothetical protein